MNFLGEREAMRVKDHWEDGFEKENFAKQVWAEAREECDDLSWGAFTRIIAKMCPETSTGLFSRRSCVRKLRYIGFRDFDVVIKDQHRFFKVGKTYESLTFNGATYTIAGYENGEKPIGCAFFDRID